MKLLKKHWGCWSMFLIIFGRRKWEKRPLQLGYLPYHLKTREMCDDAVRYYPCSLQHVPDWFVTHQKIKIWHDNNYVYNEEGLIKWCKGYRKRKAQKALVRVVNTCCLASIKMVGLVYG